MDKAILTEYDSIVLVDRSGSMATADGKNGSRWSEAQEMTTGIAAFASQVDDDGITVIQFGGQFDATRDVIDGVTTTEAVTDIFTKHTPGGATPLDKALLAAFDKKFSSKKKALIFVITDGEPSDPEGVSTAIKNAAAKLNDASEIRLLFLQVGHDATAAKYLDGLDNDLKGVKFDIVNAITYDEANKLQTIDLFQRCMEDSH